MNTFYLIVTLALSVSCDPYPCAGVDCGIDPRWSLEAARTCINPKPHATPSIAITRSSDIADQAVRNGKAVWWINPKSLTAGTMTLVKTEEYSILSGSSTIRAEGK